MAPLLALLPLLCPPSLAGELKIGVGRHPPDDEDRAWHMRIDDPHRHRFPHGPHGPAWVAVAKGPSGAGWQRVTLDCPGVLKEKRDLEDDRHTRFTRLPEGLTCTLKLRKGERRLDVELVTRGSEGGDWRYLDTAE